jgi:hypothetical protein
LTTAATRLKYLQAYPDSLQAQVLGLLERGELAALLLRKYPARHEVRTDKALFDYAVALKNSCMRHAEPLSHVSFDSKLQVIAHALGTHTTVSRVQGGKLKSKREIRIASVFKAGPPEFLRMIVVHELAHLKIRAHDKAFYQLCTYMEPAYHQYELDLRLYLTQLDVAGQMVWGD